MTTRKYSSRSQQTTLTSAVTSGALTIPVVSAATLLGGATVSTGQTFTAVIDPDTALEEIVEITVVSANNLTVNRAVDMSGAAAQDHSSGAVIRHMIIGRDLREANLHIEATGAYNDGTGTHAMHGLGSSDGVVVGTTATQTLTNKTLTAPVLTGAGVDASIIFEGTTADAYETTLTVVDPTQDNEITLPNTSGTVAILTATQTMTNKTLTSPTISGSPVITGLSSAGMSASSAAPKDYVDSILGSATAASTSATSAAASATAAATSASSAATSASLANTSANSAATSATAAATSAASAATSATAAATSATSAATQATAAATSATSAAASATTAANSVAAIATYATTASNSASAAATSASSAATSASSAATSASSAATSASSAATTYDNFDDRYLGSKSSAPSVDNDGNTLLVGAIYWNDVLNNMYVWSGSAWVQIATTSVYTAPTLGSTAINSATTYANVDGLTINSTTIPSSKTLVATDSTQYVVPSQTGNSGKFLTTDGTTSSWTNSATSFVPTGSTVPTNGMYLSGTDTVGFSTASTLRMQMNASGNLSIGAGTSTNRVISMGKSITGNATSYGILNLGAVQSDVTTSAAYYATSGGTQATAFTLGQLNHFYAIQGTLGAGSAVTNQMGYNVDASLIGATNNFGFYGQVPAGTNRWNIYMVGAAANYFNGQTSIGTSVLTLGSGSVDHQLGVLSTAAARVGMVIRGAASQTADLLQVQNSAASVLARFDASGNLGLGVAPGTKLDVTGVTRSSGYSISGTGVTGGTTAFSAGTISTDTNWGMYFRVPTSSGTNSLFSFRDAADTERLKIAASGATTVNFTTTTGAAVRNTYMSTSDPSGGADGDVWIKYA